MSSSTRIVISRLLDYIRTQGLEPGDLLPPEHVLMDSLHVSRSTLREAVRELRALHILEVRHGTGTFVSTASLDFLSEALIFRTQAPGSDVIQGLIELVDVRAMLEVGLASKIVGRLSSDQIARLYEVAARMERNEDNTQADREFHSILYENVNNEVAIQLINTFWDASAEIKIALPDAQNHIIAPRDLHEGIIEAYSGTDIQAGRKAMADHFHYIKESLYRTASGLAK